MIPYFLLKQCFSFSFQKSYISYARRKGYLSSHPPAVYDQHMPADVATRLTRQVDARALEVLGRAPSLGRYPSGDARQPVRVVEQVLVHVSGDVAGRDGVDGDAPGRPLVGEGLCELADGALGGRVGRDGQACLLYTSPSPRDSL